MITENEKLLKQAKLAAENGFMSNAEAKHWFENCELRSKSVSDDLVIVKSRDNDALNRILHSIDVYSPKYNAASVFEFPGDMLNYYRVFNFEDFCVMLKITSTLYDIRVTTDIGVVPLPPKTEEYQAPTKQSLQSLLNYSKELVDTYKRAREKQSKINEQLREILADI